MPIKLKKIFEKEDMAKGKTKEQADDIFYGFEAKHGKTFKKK
jgi:hypothetical protein